MESLHNDLLTQLPKMERQETRKRLWMRLGLIMGGRNRQRQGTSQGDRLYEAMP